MCTPLTMRCGYTGTTLEQLLTPDAPATILMMKVPQIILELSAAEGLSLIYS